MTNNNKQEIKEFMDCYDWEGLSRAFREQDIGWHEKEWKELFNLIRKQAVRDVIEAVESETRMTTRQMASHLRRKYLKNNLTLNRQYSQNMPERQNMSDNTMSVTREMPKYKSHKEVWALKIAGVEINKDKSAVLAFEDNGYAPLTTEAGWGKKFEGSEEDKGYYVVYSDGYKSWSPTKAFEDGYTKNN